ncbi:hypothetical protein [Elstera litoralis]|nr:hypothetical protein [Elstera litoralis]
MDLIVVFQNTTPANPDNLNQNDQAWQYILEVVDDLNNEPLSQEFPLAAGESLTVPLTVNDLFQTNITVSVSLPEAPGYPANTHEQVISVQPTPLVIAAVFPLDPIIRVRVAPENIAVSATLE